MISSSLETVVKATGQVAGSTPALGIKVGDVEITPAPLQGARAIKDLAGLGTGVYASRQLGVTGLPGLIEFATAIGNDPMMRSGINLDRQSLLDTLRTSDHQSERVRALAAELNARSQPVTNPRVRVWPPHDALATLPPEKLAAWYGRLADAVARERKVIDGEEPLSSRLLRAWLKNRDPDATITIEAPRHLRESKYILKGSLYHRRVFLTFEKARVGGETKWAGIVPRVQGVGYPK